MNLASSVSDLSCGMVKLISSFGFILLPSFVATIHMRNVCPKMEIWLGAQPYFHFEHGFQNLFDLCTNMHEAPP
jgi:hypothetical protein